MKSNKLAKKDLLIFVEAGLQQQRKLAMPNAALYVGLWLSG